MESGENLIGNVKKLVKRIANLFVRKQKVAMLHSGRCGSTVLGDQLNQHSHIFWSGEPFKRKKRDKNISREIFISKTLKKDESLAVSKVYINATQILDTQHLNPDAINMDVYEYCQFLKSIGYKKFIVIDRSNHLRRAISMQRGRISNEWHTKKRVDSLDKIRIDPNKFLVGENKTSSLVDYFDSIENQYQQLKKALENEDALFLNYEKDIEENPKAAYQMVCDFLGVKMEEATINYKKTNPFHVKNLIENFEEIKHALKGSKYEWMTSS